VKEARTRLFPDLQGKGIFSKSTIWHYQLEDGVEHCEHCKSNEGKDFIGTALRTAFPDLYVFDENYIWVNLHMTLWGTSTCRCFLYRAGMPSLNPELMAANPTTIFGENE
jgi:hypothetical protein